MKTIVEIYEHFSELIQDIFLNDSVFLEGFNQVCLYTIHFFLLFVRYSQQKACAKLVNNNAVTQTAGCSAKSSELLARYCDILLRKGFVEFNSLSI